MVSKKKKLAALLLLRRKWRRLRNKKKFGIHPINKLRNTLGEYHHLMPQLWQDENKFKEYLRMQPVTFQYLLNLCTPDLLKETTNFRSPIGPEERLVVTLRFLATGESFRSLGFRFRMGFSTAQGIIQETVRVIWQKLQPIEMPVPSEENWRQIAKDFFDSWNFPLCLGSIDGKHIRIKAPPNSGSQFYNYKGHFSIVLLAVADANCRFIILDVGAFGSNSDGGIFQDSVFYKALSSNRLNIPGATTIPGSESTSPFVFVGDEAFPLLKNLMRPFPRRDLSQEKTVFNYRLSRARRSVECAFGILASKWRVFLGQIETSEAFACDIVKAACALHNMTINQERSSISQQSVENCNSLECPTLRTLQPQKRRPGIEAISVRDTFVSYFTSPVGSVPWQDDRC